ncbi:hypothetical protein Pfo_029058 [Paulownia fortunei]|nr:hypothetical protein Pfo_029058 [Paulownia fortunei]
MPCSSPDIHQKSFRIKHDDDKFFTRLLSKESSKSIPSFRVYYGDVSSAVPFMWETRPGTPKHTSSDNSHIPPLTPPPSYYTNNVNNSSKKQSRSKLLFPFGILSFFRVFVSSLSWSSSSHSSYSDPMTTPTYVHKRRRFSSWGSSFDERAMDDRRDESSDGCSALIVKKALLSIIGRGSA